MKKFSLLFSLVFIMHSLSILSLLMAQEDSPFTVKLATESSLEPLYLLPMIQEDSIFEESYREQLEKILSFDLNHNGTTYLVKRSAENDRLGLATAFNQLGLLSMWKERHIFYVIKTRIHAHSLEAVFLDVQRQTLKKIDSLPITGDLANDRRQIHKLADAIHKALFQIDGIASTHILYTVKTQNSTDSRLWTSEVWECDYDGGNARQLTRENSYCVTPVYLPPKTGFSTGGFLYVSYQLGQPKIFIFSLKDGKSRRLSYMRGNQLMPCITWQRDKVAFICDITGNPDLFLQPFSLEKGAIGKPQQIFSARQATQGSPTFSPNGKQIAFVSNKDGAPKIYVIDIPPSGTSLNSIKATLISKANRENSAPSWSPDGSKIAYCARSKGDRQIWIYDFNTNQEKQITQGPGHKENPSWAFNNCHLVFNSSDPQSSQLFITNLNQLEAVQITFGKQESRFPNWEPRNYSSSINYE